MPFRLPALLLLASVLTSADVCVRSGGTGSGATWTEALPDLPATLVRGNTYYIADGTYAGRTCNTPESGTTTIAIVKATASSHGPHTGWIDAYGDGQAAFTSGIEFDSSHWILDGRTGGGPGAWTTGFGFRVTSIADSRAVLRIGYNVYSSGKSVADITLRHLDLVGKGSVSTWGGGASNDALAVYDGDGITLSHSWTHGIGRCPFFLSARNVMVDSCCVQSYFWSTDVHAEVASIWGFAGDLGDMTFRNNLFTHIKSTGGLMWDSTSNPAARLNIYGNVFYKAPGVAWDTANGLIGGWTNYPCSNVTVANNAFINVDQACFSGVPMPHAANRVRNNLFYNCQAPGFSNFPDHDYNLFIASGPVQGEAHGATGSGDPFVDPAGFDFRLTAATAAGEALGPPFDRDPFGTTRTTWTRGAYEFATTAPTWTGTDIGAAGLAGSVLWSGTTATVKGAGVDMWGTADSGFFAYQTLTGDGSLTARVASFAGGAADTAKACLMIRESSAPGARGVRSLVTKGVGTRFHYRKSTGGQTSTVIGSAARAPVWLRLERIGDVLTGYESTDGSRWTRIGSATLSGLPDQVQIGLAVCSRSTTQLATAVFEQVTIVRAPTGGG